MKLLLANPNTSEVVLEVMLGAARRAALPDTELVGISAPGGTDSIDCAYGDYMSAPHLIEAVRRRIEAAGAAEAFDAVVLAGFGNVGIGALKELLSIPVVSISEASMALACLLGHRFSCLTMLEQFIPYQQDLVRLYGFEAKCASVRGININVVEAATERERTLAALSEAVLRIVAEDGAEVVILACGGLCDYDRQLSELAGVPVIDPVIAAVKTAEALVAMGLSHSKRRKFALPPKPLAAYHGELMARDRASC
jgi:allantoin racemase